MSKQINFDIGKVSVVVPACIRIGKKNYYLNLNAYSNWHPMVRSKVKKLWTSIVLAQMIQIPKMSKIHSLKYILIRTSNRKRDRMNVYSIVDKYFCDALQEYGKIEDDSDQYIEDFNFTKTEYIKGEQSKIRVRIEIYFEK